MDCLPAIHRETADNFLKFDHMRTQPLPRVERYPLGIFGFVTERQKMFADL